MKDNFSKRPELYARYRPQYPSSLFKYISGIVNDKQLAWDCGTGNGQSAIELSQYFEKVFATDFSQQQLDHAHQAANIMYALEPAENTSLLPNTIDLVTVAQALHWFNFDGFYAEVRRVCKPDAILAVWMYDLLKIDPNIDKLIYLYHFQTLEKYWDKERKYVDDKYSSIPFPFLEIIPPPFNIEVYWTFEHLEGYLNTWSALPKFIAANDYDPLPSLMKQIKQYWPNAESKKIIFPLHLRLGRMR
ncbi:MAG: class I SAM-dependent methyltransferase [Ferruginibacter sp.]